MILRLQKYLSECGVCSRRHAEEAIKQGEVIVNGKIAEIGQSIDTEKDSIEFAGKLVERSAGLIYYAMNKPRGIETTSAQRDGQSIMDIIDVPTRVFPIGRLDKDSSGLILLTNDGRITHKLLHPSFEHEKEYLVTTYGKIDDRSLEQMRRGMRYTITEGPKDSEKKSPSSKNFPPTKKGPAHKTPTKFVQTQPCEVFRASSDTFRIILKEGKNRQIRRMVEACWHGVKKLKRIRIEHIELRDMPDGAYRELKRGEREELLRRSALPLVDFSPIMGIVIHGDGRGHELGFPTANLALPRREQSVRQAHAREEESRNEDYKEIVEMKKWSKTPPSIGGGGQIGERGGVLPDATFTCRVKIGDNIYLGAGTWNEHKVPKTPFLKGDAPPLAGEGDLLKINPPPSVNSGHLLQKGGLGTFEVHILDFSDDIYWQTIHIDIMDIIRENKKFASLEELKAQIAKDINHVRAHWKSVLSEWNLKLGK